MSVSDSYYYEFTKFCIISLFSFALGTDKGTRKRLTLRLMPLFGLINRPQYYLYFYMKIYEYMRHKNI